MIVSINKQNSKYGLKNFGYLNFSQIMFLKCPSPHNKQCPCKPKQTAVVNATGDGPSTSSPRGEEQRPQVEDRQHPREDADATGGGPSASSGEGTDATGGGPSASSPPPEQRPQAEGRQHPLLLPSRGHRRRAVSILGRTGRGHSRRQQGFSRAQTQRSRRRGVLTCLRLSHFYLYTWKRPPRRNSPFLRHREHISRPSPDAARRCRSARRRTRRPPRPDPPSGRGGPQTPPQRESRPLPSGRPRPRRPPYSRRGARGRPAPGDAHAPRQRAGRDRGPRRQPGL
ncbi:serine/arginine-rich splicing factor SR45-like [Equus quagga]|uniref:serine/arginine-rich splicing factor SR45-like n=1 Tax=Equus quagga TaxID=89248 RepID=UPI001EE24952|nr:serine/arginine-rich splicing factor SR45-like [Equus quagga]